MRIPSFKLEEFTADTLGTEQPDLGGVHSLAHRCVCFDYRGSDAFNPGGPNPLGDNSETSTKAGFAFRGGVGRRLGPGLITGEVAFAWAPIDHQITGERNLGRFSILVGYTAMFGWCGPSFPANNWRPHQPALTRSRCRVRAPCCRRWRTPTLWYDLL